MARYTIRAHSSGGAVDFKKLLTIDQAMAKAVELRDAQFEHITLINVATGVEITDLEALLVGSASTSATGGETE